MEGLKDLRVPLRLANMMRAAGFVDVESRMIQLPTCAWATGSHNLVHRRPSRSQADEFRSLEQRDNEIGEAHRENVQRMLSSLATYPFTERLG